MARFCRVILIVFLFCVPLIAAAQSSLFEESYKKYSSKDGITVRRISKIMIMAARATRDDIPPGLKEVKIITIKDKSTVSKELLKSLDTDINKVVAGLPHRLMPDYKDEKGFEIKVHSHHIKESGKLKDVVLYAMQGQKIFAVEFVGEFDKDDKFIQNTIKGKK